jgi:hypothetical protein
MFEEQSIKDNLNGSFYSQTVANSYLDYKSYCLDTGFKPLGRNNFSKRMEAIGFQKCKLIDGWYIQKNIL